MYTEPVSDLEIGRDNLRIEVTRTYNSGIDSASAFGHGWTSNNWLRAIVSTGVHAMVVLGGGRKAHFSYNTATGTYTPATGHHDAFTVDSDPNSPEPYIYTDESGVKHYFNVEGNLVRIQSPQGLELLFSRSTDYPELIDRVTDSYGRYIVYDYDWANPMGTGYRFFAPFRVASITSSDGSAVIYTYDTSNENLTRVDYSDGSYIEYQYNDPNDIHNITDIIDTNGNIIESHTYDTSDRAVTSKGPDHDITIEYTTSTQTKITNNSDGSYKIINYNSYGRVTSVSGTCSSCGNEKAYSWDTNTLNLLSSTDKNNNVTAYQNYDTRGNYGARIEKNSSNTVLRTTTYTYHPSLKEQTSVTIQSVVDPAQNKVTIYDYDDPYNPIDNPALYNENPTNLVHRVIEQGYTRDINGNQIPYEYITAYTYNALGQKTRIDGPRTDVYDVIENLYYPNDPSQGNNRGQLQAVRRYTGPSSSLETAFSNYDAMGNVGAVTDPNGNVTTYTYDSRNRLQTTTDQGTGAKTEYVYDMTGNIDYIILPRGNIIDYGYDTYNRLQTIEQKANAVTGPALARIKYTYDANGNRTKEETFDETGALQKYEDYNYNNPSDPNRLYKIINPDNSYTEFAYDGNGNKRFAENKLADSTRTHQTEYLYDALDRLTNVKQTKDLVSSATANTTYGYDLHDNLT